MQGSSGGKHRGGGTDAGRVRIRAAQIWGREQQERKGCSAKGWSVLVSIYRLPGAHQGLDSKEVSYRRLVTDDQEPGSGVAMEVDREPRGSQSWTGMCGGAGHGGLGGNLDWARLHWPPAPPLKWPLGQPPGPWDQGLVVLAHRKPSPQGVAPVSGRGHPESTPAPSPRPGIAEIVPRHPQSPHTTHHRHWLIWRVHTGIV